MLIDVYSTIVDGRSTGRAPDKLIRTFISNIKYNRGSLEFDNSMHRILECTHDPHNKQFSSKMPLSYDLVNPAFLLATM